MPPIHRRYAVTLPAPAGGHGQPTVLLVHLSDDIAPGGGHVWTDVTGHWRMQIDGETAGVLSAPAGYEDRHPCLYAVPMP
ncbi:DUF6296 family protein [Kitasatospora sp. NPDC101157]|uniref:DUF6296 family protein n=1 Tax=Kitasatospora sp. NPDC101157 TaxID=3364098 RepID=UPI0037FD6FA4